MAMKRQAVEHALWAHGHSLYDLHVHAGQTQ